MKRLVLMVAYPPMVLGDGSYYITAFPDVNS